MTIQQDVSDGDRQNTLKPGSRAVVRRKIIKSLLSGRCVRVLGPRYTGKSAIIRTTVDDVRRDLNALVSYQSLEDYKADGWHHFFARLLQNVTSEIRPDLVSGISGDCTTPFDFRVNLLSLVQQCNQNVILFIDDLEIAPPNLIASLLGVFRAVYSTLVSSSGSHFQTVVSGSLSFSQLALPYVDRFESISDLVLVQDLEEQERTVFLQTLCQTMGMEIGEPGITRLLEYTAGDQSLIRLLVRLMNEEVTPGAHRNITPDAVDRAAKTLLERVKIVGTKEASQINESIQRIEADVNLLSCAIQILQKGQVPIRELPLPSLEVPNQLDLSGLFQKDGEDYKIKCPIWQRLLEDRLTIARAGKLYALAGNWPLAMHYLGEAAVQKQDNVKLDLLNAMINAMHATASGKEAFEVLGQGLHSIYPNTTFTIYQRRSTDLTQVFPIPQNKETILGRENQALYEALKGPDYSVIFTEESSSVLFPLRISSDSEALGMIMFGEAFNHYLFEGHQEEIYLLIGFLKQATRAVEARDSYALQLRDARSRAEKQNNLNKILTHILHEHALPQEIMLRLVLAGVTSGFCLEFNRAILFLLDDERKVLVAQMGVGHMSHAEATKDWKTFNQTPHKNLDNLIQALLVTRYRYTSLHKKTVNNGLAISVKQGEENLFAQVMRDRLPRISRRLGLLEGLPVDLTDVIGRAEMFALLPFDSGSAMRGVLYVDNRFTRHEISDERIFMLGSFINQAALVIELANRLQQEHQRTLQMQALLSAEETINNQVTRDVDSVLDQIATEARLLFDAKSTVLYTLSQQGTPEQESFITDKIVYKGTNIDHSADPYPDAALGITQQIIRQGLLHFSDIPRTIVNRENEVLQRSNFVQQEGILSSVGVRLGSRDKPEGVLYLNWDSQHLLTPDERGLINIFASYAAATIPSARSYQQVQDELQHRRREMDGLGQLIHAGAEKWSDEEIGKIVQQAISTTIDLTQVKSMYIVRRGPGNEYIKYELDSSGEMQIQVMDTVEDEIIQQTFLQDPGTLQDLHTKHGSYLPIQVNGNVFGVLWMETVPDRVLEKHQNYLNHLCNRLALTFHQSEVYHALTNLFQTALQITQGAVQEQFLGTFMKSLVKDAWDSLSSVDTITTYYFEKDGTSLKTGPMVGLLDESSVLQNTIDENSVMTQVLLAPGPIFAKNVRENSILNVAFIEREHIKSAAAFPLQVGGKRLGAMFFSYRHYHTFDPGESRLLSLFAQLAAIAINYAWMVEQANQQQQHLKTVASIAENLTQAGPDLDAIYRNLLNKVLQALPHAHHACIIQKDLDRQDYIIVPASHPTYPAAPQSGQETYRFGKSSPRSIAVRVIEQGVGEIINDVDGDQDYIQAIMSTHAEICVPIVLDGRPQAAILLESDDRNVFTADDKSFLEGLAPLIAVAIQRVQQLLHVREQEEREKMRDLSIALVHEVTRAVANIPDLVNEIHESLSKDEYPDQECLDDLRENAINTKRVSTMVRDLCYMGYFKPKQANLEPVIETVKEQVRSSIPEPILISIHHPAPLPILTFDEALIEVLLRNLLENAVRAIPPGRSGRIQIITEVRSTEVAITIHDDGVGISSENQTKVFEQPFTTKADASQMHGMGLWLCKQIATLHKARIISETHPGIGTAITLLLPL